ncbi:unnamed protein product, partial [Meganyctiphanes norvegica]
EAVSKISGTQDMYVQLGSPVKLTCTITDLIEPPTYVFWYHDDQMINYGDKVRVANSEAGSELYIMNARLDDSGNYTCQPSNASPASVDLHIITGETPAAMQRASATDVQHRLSLA